MEIESQVIDPYFTFLETTIESLEKVIQSKDQRLINLTLLLSEKYKKSVKAHHMEMVASKLNINLNVDFKCNQINF